MANGKQPRDAMIEQDAKWSVDLGLGKNYVAGTGAPVSFTAHLDSITPGQTQQMNTSGLANGYRTPYLIDEIRMQGFMADPSTTVLQPSYALKFQFRTGAYSFSLRPVPMVLYSPRYGASPTYNSLYTVNLDPRGPLLVSEFTGAAFQVGDSARWVLAKPLWMAPGDQIQCVVERDATAASLGGGAFTVDVTYVGRSLAPGTRGPGIRYVPWAAHFIYDMQADTYAETTTEFRNQFMKPMTIQKFIGRPLSKATSATSLDLGNSVPAFPTSGQSGTLPMAGLGTRDSFYPTVNIQDSMGYKITNQFAPVGNVFDSERCAWTFARPLGPREQINMQFQRKGTAASDVLGQIYGVSMLGYREERG